MKHFLVLGFAAILAPFQSALAYELIQISPDDGPVRCMIWDSSAYMARSLSPERTVVNTLITDGVAQVEVLQQFINPLSTVTQANYVFPLPHQASVHAMGYLVNGTWYESHIMDRDTAQAIFDSVTQAGGVAAMLVQNRPNIFQQSLANLGPGDTAWVQIRLSMPLNWNNGVFEFAFPTMVGDRCCNSGSEPIYGTNGGWNPPALVEGPRIQFNIALQSNFDLTAITSPTHPLQILGGTSVDSLLVERGVIDSSSGMTQSYQQGVFLGTGSTYPNSDFVLRFQAASSGTKFTAAGYLDASDNRWFMASLYPDTSLFTGNRNNIDLMLLVDKSGSQDGWPLQKEIDIANALVDQLQSGDRLCVMSFDDYQYLAFSDTIRAANSANINIAHSFISSISTGGSTELYQAILALSQIPNPDNHLRVYVFLTDGFITNESTILAYLSSLSPTPQILTFGAGNNLNRYFLEESAAIGNGFSTELVETDDPEAKATEAMSRISAPAFTNLQASFTAPVKDTLLPSPSLFRGMPWRILGRTESGSGMLGIHVSGTQNNKQVSFGADLDLTKVNATGWVIPKLWAREKIRRLDLAEGTSDSLKQPIIAISVQYQVLSKYTAFIAWQGVDMVNANLSPGLNYVLSSPTPTVEIPIGILAFDWKRLQIIRHGDQIFFHWDAAMDLRGLEVFDLKGQLLFAWDGKSPGNVVWTASNYRAQSALRGALLVRVQTSAGYEGRVYTLGQ